VQYAGAFASGSRHAQWLGAHCPVFERDGTPRRNARGAQELRTMIYPKSQAEVLDVWRTIGLRGTGSDSFVLRDLHVPEAYTVLREDPASRRDPAPLYRMTANMIYASGFASVALGIARTVMDTFLDIAQDKTPRGMGRTLRDSALVQAEVALCEAKWSASRGYLHRCLGDVWESVQREPVAPDAQRMALRLAATYAIHQAKEVVDTIYDAAGATAIFEANPFERRFRDIHTVTQQVQGRKAFFETVGQYMLGHGANTTWI
jgi:alkylation response protein AidB-like acyl-CoA dehydrogenase